MASTTASAARPPRPPPAARARRSTTSAAATASVTGHSATRTAPDASRTAMATAIATALAHAAAGGTIAAIVPGSLKRLTTSSKSPARCARGYVSGGKPLAIRLTPKTRNSTAMTASLCTASQSFISSSRALACSPPTK